MKNLILFLLFTISLYSCKDKCKEANCRNGFECNEGKCDCPEGKVNLGAKCRTLQSTEYYSTIKCQCLDTFSLGIGGYTTHKADGTIDSTIRTFGMNIKDDSGGSTDGEYYKKPDGDSIYTLLATTFEATCYVNEDFIAANFGGKISKDKKQIKGKIYWWSLFNGSPKVPIDSCEIILHK